MSIPTGATVDLAHSNELKELIRRFIAERGNVSFIELEIHFPAEFKKVPGVITFYLSEENNVFLWDGGTLEFFSALDQLMSEAKIVADPCPKLLYEIDGLRIDFPVAISATQKYSSKHWLPVAFNAKK